MYQIPLQRDVDHLIVALWRAKVWLNERSRAVRKAPPLPHIPRLIESRDLLPMPKPQAS